MAVIDAHQHVWDLSRSPYAWLTSAPDSLNRTIDFDAVVPELRAAGIDATVLVQADDDAGDTAHMLEVAAAHPEVVGVVAYAPLHEPANAARRLESLRQDPLVVGIRNLVHDRPDPDWLLRPDVDESLGLLEEADVPFDLVGVLPRHLEIIPILSERHPRLRMVVDHLNKPPIGLSEREPWWSLIAAAADNPLVSAKVSGLYSATADGGAWTVDQVRPFVERAIELFGADRLMYGGDWPVSVPNGGYQRVWSGLSQILADVDADARRAILGTTAQSFYGIAQARVDAAVAQRITTSGETPPTLR
ncbi:metal-dependent hydrolase [Frondihabitans sp. PAMC 28766]|uniref:amidohydrolase family protein n=1 Tax=Frondihabitans sp. PAMC 28766 TaxID=1795630 RepID=UPI00078BB8EB|nr:amidohydrolase family protein [Frondihabitans sp. PAMC 28766]AMM21600.1 metal-dependent hydrolase [Frondihabitans sp. PAMC 28766]